MKHLKSPYFPLFILLIILSAFGYRSFFDADYTQTEKEIFALNYHQNLGLRQEYANLAQRTQKNAQGKFREEGGEQNDCAREMYKSLEIKMNNLSKIYEGIHLNYFEKTKVELKEEEFPPKLSNPKVVTAINEYVQKVSKLDSSLANNYKDFVFEEGMTDKELDDFYFDTDDYLRAFHYSRFEVELSKMYYEDIKQLSQNYFLYPLPMKIEDAKVVPYVWYDRSSNLDKGKYTIKTMSVFSFDKLKSRLVYPKNIETEFDENGFIIIPKEFQKGVQLFQVKIPILCDRDTTLGIKIDFDYRDTYYKNEK